MAKLDKIRDLRPRRVAANRSFRLLDHATSAVLVSVAGLVRAPVRNQAGGEIGTVEDVVVRWQGEPYPPVTGLVVKVGRRRAWIPATHIGLIEARSVTLSSARIDLRDYERRPGEVAANADVVDHQMVDVDGVRVFRAADLYLTRLDGDHVLVGADVGMTTLLRRLGPARFRGRPTPDRVIDWAAIQPFSDPGGPVRLTRANQDLARLRPGELADLLEDLGRHQREELLRALDKDAAADALEEMRGDDLKNLLRELPTAQTAAVVAAMEPDEAAEALRDLDPGTRAGLLAHMDPADAERLRPLLEYQDTSAGGLMTTNIVTVPAAATVAEVRDQLIHHADRVDVDGILVIDEAGALTADLHLLDLFTAAPDQVVLGLVRERDRQPVTVDSGADITAVIDALIETRASSVVVVDPQDRPIGRILADDIIDALVSDRGRVRFPRILS